MDDRAGGIIHELLERYYTAHADELDGRPDGEGDSIPESSIMRTAIKEFKREYAYLVLIGILFVYIILINVQASTIQQEIQLNTLLNETYNQGFRDGAIGVLTVFNQDIDSLGYILLPINDTYVRRLIPG